MQIDSVTLAELMHRASDERCSVTVTIEPDRTEIQIEPWEPFHYSCPYGKQNTA